MHKIQETVEDLIKRLTFDMNLILHRPTIGLHILPLLPASLSFFKSIPSVLDMNHF